MLRLRTTLSALLLLSTALPEPGDAQELRYTTVTEVQLGGALGRALAAVPGGGRSETEQTIWIDGSRMRTDTDGHSSIVDFSSGRWLDLDHDLRLYHEWNLGEMGQTVQEALARPEGPASAEGAARAQSSGAQAEARLDVRLSTDRTGRQREIEGFRTEQVLVTLEIHGEDLTIQEGSEEDLAQEDGTLVLLTELWVTQDPALVPDFDGTDLTGYRDMAATDAKAMVGVEQAFAGDPRLQVAFDRSRAELEHLEGTPVESTLFWVVVPEDDTFDRAAALADADRDLGDDLAGAAASGAKQAASNAVRQGLGRLGRFGRGSGEAEPQPEPAEPELVQSTIMRLKTRLTDVQRGGFPPSTFELPAGYRPAPTADAGGGG